MPKATKETIELEEKNKLKNAKVAIKSSSGKTSKQTKNSTTQKTAVKKDTKTIEAKKGVTKTASKKKTAITDAVSNKKISSEKNIEKSSTSKTKTTRKAKKSSTIKKGSTKAQSTTKKKTSSKSVKNEIIEYYDLPYRYNKTIVKILAQTPKKLFVYWDISDTDRKNFIKTYGENFFEVTKPVLVIRNTTMNYTFEIDINDFANSWYLNINDSDCHYSVELGRRPIYSNSHINTDYIYVSSSNNIEGPNDHILFENSQNMVYFRNVKTNVISARNITSLSFLTNMGKIYNIYDLYKKIYADEELDELNNPSSSFFK